MANRTANDYTTIKLPDMMVEKIDAYMQHSDDGYTSRTDLIKTALRTFFKSNDFNNNGGNNGNSD